MNPILDRLSDGDLRSEGKAEEVASEVIADPLLLSDLSPGLQSEDKVIRGRTCMTMEIVSRAHPELLDDIVPQLIDLAAKDKVPQVRWHLAEIFSNVHIPDEQIERVVLIMLEYSGDKSKIVKYCAVQALGVIGLRIPFREEIRTGIDAVRNDSKSLEKIVSQTLKGFESA